MIIFINNVILLLCTQSYYLYYLVKKKKNMWTCQIALVHSQLTIYQTLALAIAAMLCLSLGGLSGKNRLLRCYLNRYYNPKTGEIVRDNLLTLQFSPGSCTRDSGGPECILCSCSSPDRAN